MLLFFMIMIFDLSYVLLVLSLLWFYFYMLNMINTSKDIDVMKSYLKQAISGDYALKKSEGIATELSELHDISAEMIAKLKSKNSLLQEYKRVIDASAPVVKTDANGKINYMNEAYEKLSGYTLQELYGKNHAIIRSEDTTDAFIQTFWKKLLDKKTFKGEFKNINKQGEAFYVESTVVPILDAEGNIYEYISVMFDITERKKQKESLKQQLYINAMTRLPNREALRHDLDVDPKQNLLILNIDAFATINTIYGESIGNDVIVRLSVKLKEMLSNQNLKLYHFSGDEFAIAANGTIDTMSFKEDVILLSHQLSNLKFHSFKYQVGVRIRMGAALYDDDNNMRSLISRATLAASEAKKQKKAYLFYSKDVDELLHLEENLLTLERVEYALSHNGVKVHFQPIYNLKTGRVEKFEALVRIVDAKGKTHFPASFITLAKVARYYSKLSKIVFVQTLAMAENNPMYDYSYNIEMTDIQDANMRAFILDRLFNSNCAERIVFELVESQEIEENTPLIEFVTRLKEMGSKIAIDDFGSGYSNYAYLSKLGVDIVKIDGSLISDIVHDHSKQLIVRSIINIVHELKMSVVAEYIETPEGFYMLKEMGADFAQGHYISTLE